MKAHERFLTYTTYATESREESPTNPSSKEQFVLANALADARDRAGRIGHRREGHRVEVDGRCENT